MSKIDTLLEDLMQQIHPKLGKIYKDSPQLQRLAKFTIVAFIPFLPTLFFAATFGFWIGLGWAAGTHLLKFIINDLWTWRQEKKEK